MLRSLGPFATPDCAPFLPIRLCRSDVRIEESETENVVWPSVSECWKPMSFAKSHSRVWWAPSKITRLFAPSGHHRVALHAKHATYLVALLEARVAGGDHAANPECAHHVADANRRDV